MEVITDSYDNISIHQLYSKLSQKYSQLEKLDQKEQLEKVQKSDHFDISTAPKNYDEQDFKRVLEKFKKTDANIRSHEQVHATIGVTTAPISYVYQQGPDGKMYAVGGHVKFDVSLPDDPKAASYKLDQIKKAASAPSEISSADSTISMQATLNKMLIDLKGENNAG